MKNIILIIFLLTRINSFGQTCCFNEFYDKVYQDKIFDEFSDKNLPSFAVGDNQTTPSKTDTTPVNKSSVFTFVKHPQMDSSSKGGRLEIFTSVCADGSCVYEASQKIFISFSSKTEAKTYMEKLIKPLLGPDVKESVSKKDNIEIHRLSGPARPGKACQITFKLIQDKKKKVFDVYIGHF